jgi:hypothetical protein
VIDAHTVDVGRRVERAEVDHGDARTQIRQHSVEGFRLYSMGYEAERAVLLDERAETEFGQVFEAAEQDRDGASRLHRFLIGRSG